MLLFLRTGIRYALLLILSCPLSAQETPHAIERPDLPSDVAAEVEALEKELFEVRSDFLYGRTESIDHAISVARRIYSLRQEHQQGWADAAGEPSIWHEVADASRLVSDLEALVKLSAEERSSLAETDEFAARSMQHWRSREFDECLALDQQAWETCERILGPDHPETLHALMNLVSLRGALGQTEAAMELSKQHLERASRILGPEHPASLSSLANYAALIRQEGRLGEAEPMYRDALRRKERVLGPNHPSTITSLNNLGVLRWEQGYLVEAHDLLRVGYERCHRALGENHIDTAETASNLGAILQGQGRLREAESFYRSALERLRVSLGDNNSSTLLALGNVGAVLNAQGKFAEAEPFYRETLDGLRESLGESHPATILAVNNLGTFLSQQGRDAEAASYLRDAASRAAQVVGDNHPQTLLIRANLGDLIGGMGDLSAAEHILSDVLARQRSEPGVQHPHTLTSMSNLAQLYRKMGELEAATRLAHEALDGRRSLLGNDHPDTLISIHNVATLLTAQGELNASEPLVREALDGKRRVLGTEHLSTLTSIRAMGRLLEAQGKLAEAERYELEAMAISQKLRGSATGGERGRAAMAEAVRLRDIAANVCRHMIRRGAFARAWSVSEQGRGRALLDLLMRSDINLRSQMIDPESLDIATRDEIEARVSLHVAEARLAAMKKERVSITRDHTVDEEERETRLQAFDLALETQHEFVVRARRDLGNATAKVFLAVQGAMPDARPLNIDEIQARLEPGDLLLSYTWSEQAVLLLTATSESVYGVSLTSNATDTDSLGRTLVELRERMAKRPAETAAAGSRTAEVFGRLMPESIRDGVRAANRVIVLPDGPLTDIPFAAIADTDILDDERQQVVYASSATVHLNRRAAALQQEEHGSELTLVALGDPIFDNPSESTTDPATRSMDERIAEASLLDTIRLHGGTLPRLPGTRTEVQRIRETVGDNAIALLGKDATLANLESSVEGARYVHIATHGLVGSQDRPYDASLALTSPGTPTVDDIGFLTLDRLIRTWQGRLEGCDLVTLSACDTRRGIRKGDSLMALPWGFYYAGAPTVVASLWPIDDDATAMLMSRFYENLLGSHEDARTIRGSTYATGDTMPKADALQEAKRWLRSYEVQERGVGRSAVRRPDDEPNVRRPYEHPYYWAAFVLTGDPG